MTPPDQKEWVIETIREAERVIEQADYPKALEVLRSARSVEPSNMYIVAIIERVETLMRNSRKTASDLQALLERKTPLTGIGRSSVPQPGHGGMSGSASEATPRNVSSAQEATIKRLTSAATHLFEHGSYDQAFESLMKAYLIDPTNAAVSECERKLLPAFEQLKSVSSVSGLAESMKQGTDANRSVEVSEFLTRKGGLKEIAAGGPGPSRAASSSTDQKISLQSRLEALKGKREAERKERERAIWHAASSPPLRPSPVPRTPSGAESQRQKTGSP